MAGRGRMSEALSLFVWYAFLAAQSFLAIMINASVMKKAEIMQVTAPCS